MTTFPRAYPASKCRIASGTSVSGLCALKPGYDYTNEFGFGLDLILDGLEKDRDTA